MSLPLTERHGPWTVDELLPAPKLTAFRLDDGVYAQIGVSRSTIHLTRPFPVDIDPSRLLGRRRT